ncbi:GumC family protein [Terriglobus tenax]|uniref:GumC family protein n=1 Tax=Terriglobus tenax TaxID=1111115 RepID=UPI0021E06F69|nr:Wzz/FepE/Etk N-terminal domain-containing protein [Terriglobus tenax]
MTEPKSSFSLRDVIEIAFRRKKMIFTIIPLVTMFAIVITALTHRVFQSEMKFLVQNSRGNVIISAEKTAATTAANDVTEQQINSELEILYSRDVLEPVADPAWDPRYASTRSPEEVRQHEKLVSDFQRHLSAEPTRKSNVINVSLTADSPAMAQATLQRLSTAYLAEHRKLQRPPGASDFFSNEADRYRKAWDEATQKLVEFQQQHQLVTTADQQTSLEKDIATAQTNLRDTDVSLHELEARMKADSRKLSQTPQRQVTTRKTVPNQQSIQQLSSLVVELENKRTALLTQFRSDDRLVKEIDQQLMQTREALNNAIGSSAEELTSDVDPTWQQLRTVYVQDEIKHAATVQQKNALIQQIASLNKKMGEVQGLTVPFNLLQSRAENLKENYTLYMQKRDQAQIEDAMDERKLLNVAIAESPTLSYMPVKPKPLTNLALGLASAVFIALACVYFAEMTRTTISTPRELESLSRHPVLATLPVASRIYEATLMPPTLPRTPNTSLLIHRKERL